MKAFEDAERQIATEKQSEKQRETGEADNLVGVLPKLVWAEIMTNELRLALDWIHMQPLLGGIIGRFDRGSKTVKVDEEHVNYR